MEIAKGLLSGKDVLIDATNVSKSRRKFFIDLIRAKNKEIEIECHFIAPNLELSKERNKVRERKLPVEVLDAQFAKWQVPTLEEGFSKIVKID